ncbi:GldG family protein [Maricaulis sp.]|uniref:GldG family protein n=1 Tax=Maricaulis sp. TaxID=1486257 RepID=UPI0026076197|nr:GldG family protein [Maricaulis sp.]
MKRSLYMPLMVISLIVLFLAGNQITGHAFRSWRIDLTAGGLYRLSPGTLDVMDRLAEPVEWRFYYSRAEAAQYPAIRAYATRVREMLQAYADRSGGLIRLVEIDPEPFSADEDAALAAGLTAVPGESGESLYFGLVARNSVDDEAVIDVFREDSEARLEYDLTRVLADLERPARPRLAILTSLPISPEDGAPNRFVRELAGAYELIWVERDFDSLPDAEALLILHPGELTQGQLYLVDQYALTHGRVLVFLDPLAHMAMRPGPDGLPPINARRASDLGPLPARWGLAYDPQTVAMDRALGLPVEIVESDGRARRRAYPLWFSAGAEELSDADIATATLDLGVNFGSPGRLEAIGLEHVSVTPLVTTSAEGALLDVDVAAGAPGPDALLRDYRTAPEPLVLAARVSGAMDTAFPDGPPPGEILFSPADHVETAPAPVDITIVADADWLDDTYYVRNDPATGESLVADNLVLAMNLVDMAAGDPALIGLRSRTPSLRPMTRVERLRDEAEARYVEIQNALEAEIAEAEARLDTLTGSGRASAFLSGSDAAGREEAERLRRQIAETRAELRAVERDFRRDIDALNASLQFWTIGVPPALVILAGLAGAVVRRRRRAP